MPPPTLLASAVVVAALAATCPSPAAALDDYAASFGKQQQQQSSSQQQQQGAAAAGAAASSSSASSAYDAHTTRRERNLDHWDADTLAAYLGMDPEDGTPLPAASDVPPTAGALSSSSSAADGSAPPSTPRTDSYLGHDAAILFYAQWCPNCHALAPNWDAIATLLNAGSSKSNLIMALFDCERDVRHAKLCGAAGVTHYPTLLFVGSGEYRDTDPVTRTLFGRDKSAGPAGASKLRRTVKFQGDWRYGDQVLDWVKAMRALSAWHRLNTEGVLGTLRRGIFGLFRKGGGKAGRGGAKGGRSGDSLPVGIPPSYFTEVGGGGGGGGGPTTYALERKVKTMEAKLQSTEQGKADLEKAATHASFVIDAVLFPVKPAAGGPGASSNGTSYIDPFAVLAANGGWDAKSIEPPETSPSSTADGDAASASKDPAAAVDPFLLRTCVVDLSLDYCTRTSTKVTTDFLDELTENPDADYPSLFELDGVLQKRVADVEPYCALFDKCFASDFTGEGCRPETCPFDNDAACRVVAGCFDKRIQEEYVEALAKVAEEEEEKAAAKTKAAGGRAKKKDAGEGGATTAGAAKAEGKKKKKAKKAWGFA